MKKIGDSSNGSRIIKLLTLAELACCADQNGIIRLTKKQIKDRLERRLILLPERPQNLITLSSIIDHLIDEDCLSRIYRLSPADYRTRLRCGRHFFLKINWPRTARELQELPHFETDPAELAKERAVLNKLAEPCEERS